MEYQTPSMLDQNRNKDRNTRKIKPIHFLIFFIGISTLIAFIVGGYFIGKNNSKKEKQNAAVELKEQVKIDPVSLPGNPDNWTVYKFEPIKLEFKLPEELNKKRVWKVNEINGKSGKSLCFSDEEVKNECKGETLVIASSSKNFASEKNNTFLDSQGFESKGGTYSIMTLTGENFKLNDLKFKTFENNKNLEILKIVGNGNEVSGTPKDGYLYAIINTKKSEYPAIVLRMKINSDISEYEFDQILESLQINK